MNQNKWVIDGKEVGVEGIPEGAIVEGYIAQPASNIVGFFKDGKVGHDGFKYKSLCVDGPIRLHSIRDMQKMWMVTDKDGVTRAFYIKPIRSSFLDHPIWVAQVGGGVHQKLDKSFGQTWEDGPREIWVKI